MNSAKESPIDILHRVVSESLGEPIEQIQNMPLCERQRRIERKTLTPMTVRSCSGHYLSSTEEIEIELDETLGYSPVMIKIRSLIRRRIWLGSLLKPRH